MLNYCNLTKGTITIVMTCKYHFLFRHAPRRRFYGSLGMLQVAQVTIHNPWCSSVGRAVVVQGYDRDSLIRNIANYFK